MPLAPAHIFGGINLKNNRYLWGKCGHVRQVLRKSFEDVYKRQAVVCLLGAGTNHFGLILAEDDGEDLDVSIC